jgi:hypothetical protein
MTTQKIQVKRTEWPWIIDVETDLLYLDAGAWQGDEKGAFKTNFVLVSGRGVALCNFHDVPSSWHSNFRKKSAPPEWLLEVGDVIEDDFYDCNIIYDFLTQMDPSGYYLDHVQYFYVSRTNDTKGNNAHFWDKNSLLIIIGDLHLHLFRQSGDKRVLVDNFIKKVGGKRVSLEKDFCDFLEKIDRFQKNNPRVRLNIVQAGDIIDIWEIEYLFNAISSDFMVARSRQGSRFLNYFVSNGVLSKEYKLKAFGLKKFMQENVFAELFKSINELTDRGIPFTVLQGNHDDALKYATEFNQGPDYLIHIEHGHRFDSANEPGGDSLGRFLTKLNVDFEEMGCGDWFKSLEGPAVKLKKWLLYVLTFGIYLPLEQRETYIEASKDVNSWFEKERKKKLSMFVMAHTHIPYARKVPR